MYLRRIIAALLIIFLIFLPIETYGHRHHKHAKPAPLPAWCQVQGYHCVRIKEGQSWTSLFPDEIERDIVMRVNRTNNSLYGGLVIKVPDNLATADVLDYAPFQRKIEQQGEKLIMVDLTQNAWAAYDAEGSLVRWGPATGGSSWCKDINHACPTKAGHFRVYSLGSSSCVSRKLPLPRGGAPMPYCMFFDGGQALHGSPRGVTNDNVSHGCVRLYVSDAEWLLLIQ